MRNNILSSQGGSLNSKVLIEIINRLNFDDTQKNNFIKIVNDSLQKISNNTTKTQNVSQQELEDLKSLFEDENIYQLLAKFDGPELTDNLRARYGNQHIFKNMKALGIAIVKETLTNTEIPLKVLLDYLAIHRNCMAQMQLTRKSDCFGLPITTDGIISKND